MLIALVGKAYTGKTSIARELERRGWQVASFTDALKSLAAFALNSVGPAQLITLADILADKPRYRRFIQEFGSLIGFETDRGWIEGYLDDLGHTGVLAGDVVIDCLRSAAQIEGARTFGAKIVGVYSELLDREAFAGDWALVAAADQHPIDGALDVLTIGCDHVFPNNRSRRVVDVVSAILEKTHEDL